MAPLGEFGMVMAKAIEQPGLLDGWLGEGIPGTV